MVDPLTKKILDLQKEYLEALVLSPAITFDGYMRNVGIWHGLQEALDIIANEEKDDN
jgi:hypothetical protein